VENAAFDEFWKGFDIEREGVDIGEGACVV